MSTIRMISCIGEYALDFVKLVVILNRLIQKIPEDQKPKIVEVIK